ncbi:hypothetical protein AB6A40_003998 [Gnathostoma spinigerum]|uniref:Uncharacterized protein n=1 Tax=Gnathostoma spinigerum TaxID=75299 RepID=A0ABD6EGM7_9BILA
MAKKSILPMSLPAFGKKVTEDMKGKACSQSRRNASAYIKLRIRIDPNEPYSLDIICNDIPSVLNRNCYYDASDILTSGYGPTHVTGHDFLRADSCCSPKETQSNAVARLGQSWKSCPNGPFMVC